MTDRHPFTPGSRPDRRPDNLPGRSGDAVAHSVHGMVMTLPAGALLPDGSLRLPEASLPIGTRLGEFEISGLIGEGGFGIVYMAVDHLLGRQVALKEYMPTSLAARGARAQVGVKSPRHAETFEAGLRSFVNEARMLAQFDHPALVKVFRFWEANGTAYMVMPYYHGRTLRQALTDLGAPPSQAWLQQLLPPLFDALETLHAAQCYHRDIAPDNILLLDNGKPVLLDFGAARRVIGDITQALTVILKPGFAPVEQYANGPEMRQGPWTDVYALAAVIYYCATLKTPVPSVSRMMKDTLQPFGELAGARYDEPFCAAVDKGLAVAIEARFQDMAAFRDALCLDAPAGAGRTEMRTAVPWGIGGGIGGGGGGGGNDSNDGLSATIVDPSAYIRAGGAGAGGRPHQPSHSFNQEMAMSAAAPPPPEKSDKPWTPNADSQLERVAAEMDLASRRGATPWLPIAAAVVVLAAAGIGGYWFWNSAQAPADQGAQAPAATGPAIAPAPATSASPATAQAPATVPAPSPSAATSPSGAPSQSGSPPLPPLIPSLVPSPAPSLVPSLIPQAPPTSGTLAGGPSGSIDSGSDLLPVARIIDTLHQQRDPDWPVTVKLASDRVRIGKDRLSFRLRSEREGYVYLLMQGTDRSHFYQLFPNGLDRNNRLRGKVDLALPRANWEMVAGGPPGLNRFIALVTPTPRDFTSAGLNSSQPFSEFDLQAAARVFTDKGAAPFAGEPAGCKRDAQSCAAYGSVLFEIEEY